MRSRTPKTHISVESFSYGARGAFLRVVLYCSAQALFTVAFVIMIGFVALRCPVPECSAFDVPPSLWGALAVSFSVVLVALASSVLSMFANKVRAAYMVGSLVSFVILILAIANWGSAFLMIVFALIPFAMTTVICVTACSKDGVFSSYARRDDFKLLAVTSSVTMVVASTALFALLLLALSEFRSVSWELVFSIALTSANAFVFVWVYVRCSTYESPDYFAAIRAIDYNSSFGLMLKKIEHMGERDPDAAEALFCLLALVCPSEVVSQIREEVEPRDGSCRVETMFEFTAPACLAERFLLVPTILQKKTELTDALSIEGEDGCVKAFAHDEEVIGSVTRWLSTLIQLRAGSSIGYVDVEEAARCAARAAFEDDPDCYVEKAKSNRDEARKLFERALGADDELLADVMRVVEYMWETYEHVKPICVREPLRSSFGDTSVVFRVKATRVTPLVPLRLTAGPMSRRCLNVVKRVFAKKRLRYYFNMANADRTESYHLRYLGPEGAYFTESRLRLCDAPARMPFPYAIARQMTFTNRYDSKSSHVYVRGGRGFANVALQFTFERKSHAPVISVLGISCTVLLLLLYFAWEKVLIRGGGSGGGGDFFTFFFGVLTFVSLTSVWDNLGSNHAEEWVWMAAFTTLVTSVLALVDSLMIGVSVSWADWRPTLWVALTSIEFSVALSVGTLLFQRVKQHGCCIESIPITKSMRADMDVFEEESRFSEMEKRFDPYYRNDLDFIGRIKITAHSPRRQRYRADISAYEGLYGSNWEDGWLIPIWAAYCDPRLVPRSKANEARVEVPVVRPHGSRWAKVLSGRQERQAVLRRKDKNERVFKDRRLVIEAAGPRAREIRSSVFDPFFVIGKSC